jgi:phytoene dehydrogenase-like protein
MDVSDVEVVVIGSGVGGLCAAATLAHAGRRVLVVEREPRVGGRASTEVLDGFKLPTGGVALELGGPMERLARRVGAGYDVREPGVGVVLKVGRRTIDTTNRPMQMVVDRLALPLARRFTRGWSPGPAADRLTLEQALRRVTRNAMIHRLARNFAAGVFGLNADEVPARAVAVYLTQKGAFRRYGFCPRGSIGVMEDLAAVVVRHGGAVWTSTTATAIELTAGSATAVTLGASTTDTVAQALRVPCDAVISNVGPAGTVRLIGAERLPEGYVAEIRERDVPTPMIVVDFASDAPLAGEAGIVFFTDTTRLSAVAQLASSCPEVAPPGQRLYVAYSVPVPALGPYDAEAEIAHTLRELSEQLPGFHRARALRTRLVEGDWPAQRAVCGREMPMQTPVPNVINVGDGVRMYGDGGTQACAVTGELAAQHVLTGSAPDQPASPRGVSSTRNSPYSSVTRRPRHSPSNGSPLSGRKR